MSPTRFEEVVFMDDFFRSSDNLLASHPSNRRFLRRTFGLAASRLGIECRDLSARSDGGTLEVATMMRELGLPLGPAGWAKSCIAELSPLLDPGLVPRLGPGTLVIGWGLTPSLLHLLDRQDVAFIDIEISPRRFASHLAFCVRTNDRQIEAMLSRWRIDDESFWNEAAALKGYFSRRGAAHLFDRGLRVGLFCGQTAVDLALVQGGEIARPIDVSDSAAVLARQVDLLVIKPHPYEPDLRHLQALAGRIENVSWTDANIYALLCADNLQFVCSLSSGALQEASYFMKTAVRLITPDRNDPAALPASCCDWMTVGPGIASIECLAACCSAAPGPAPRPSAFPDDALDRAFGARWGLDAHDPGLPDPPALEPGRIYALRNSSLPNGWLSFGWSAPAPGGVAPKGPLANIVVPLRADIWPLGTEPGIEINGRPYCDGKSGFRLSTRLNGRGTARALVLEFAFAPDAPAFRLHQLRIFATTPSNHERVRGTALSTLAVVVLIACLLGMAKHLSIGADTQQAGAGMTQVQQVIGTGIDAMRDDIHLFLQRHHI